MNNTYTSIKHRPYIKITTRAFLLVLISLWSQLSFAQTVFCPPNIDFENGNLNNWEFFTGSCCPIAVLPSGAVFNRHTLTSGTNTDTYGKFPIVAISGGSYSLRLGNTNVNGKAERARYYIHVPNNAAKNVLLYRYAIVLEDPGHSPQSQPRFEVNAFDSATNQQLPCAHVTYVASSSLPGFVRSKYSTNTPVYYKPWTTATIDLSGYAGRTVAIDFSSGDCGAGGHFGYGYIDMNCGLFQIEGTICDSAVGQITLNGPQGYQSYEWRDATLMNVIGTTQTITIPTPSIGTQFAVIMTPYPGFGCQDTIFTTFTQPVYSSVRVNAYGDTTICIGAKANIRAVASGGYGPYSYEWSPALGLSCTYCDNPTVTGSSTGIYTVSAKNMLGCADTGYVTIGIDSFVKVKLVADDTICSSSPIMVVNALQNNPLGKVQSWYTNGGSVIYGGGQSDTVTVKYNVPGAKKIALDVSMGECNTQDTVNFFVGTEFVITTTPDDTICPGKSKQLNVTSNSTNPVNYNWTPAATLSCSKCNNPVATPVTKVTYTVYATDNLGCFDTGYVKFIVDSMTYADFTISADTICVNELLGLKNKGNNPDIIGYLWGVDSGSVIYGAGTDSISVFWATGGTKMIVHKTYRGSCETRDTAEVYVIEYPRPGFEIPSYGCEGEPIDLFPMEGPPHFKWYVQEQEIADEIYQPQYTLTWSTTGTKKVKVVVNDHHCIDSFIKEIDIYPFPIANITIDNNDPVCIGREVKMKATKGDRYTYGWEPARVFNANNQPEVIATVERTEGYYLQVTNQWGCTAYDTILVNADACCDIPMADAFTPNGDSHNDRFGLINMDKKQLVMFMIANRRGQVVFQTNNINDKWDGTLDGKPLGQDTYNYYVKYICNDSKELVKKGTVILLR